MKVLTTIEDIEVASIECKQKVMWMSVGGVALLSASIWYSWLGILSVFFFLSAFVNHIDRRYFDLKKVILQLKNE